MDATTLVEACVKKCVQIFQGLCKLKPDVAQDYIYSNYPPSVLRMLTPELNYDISEELTILILPYLMVSGKLDLTDDNLVKAVNWIEEHQEVHTKLESIYHLHVRVDEQNHSDDYDSDDYDSDDYDSDDYDSDDYDSDNSSGTSLIDTPAEDENRLHVSFEKNLALHKLLSLLPNLKTLVLDFCATDILIEKVEQSCKKLQSFQAYYLNRCNISDLGLTLLSYLTNLEIVRFTNISDDPFGSEYSYTKIGFAILLSSLPKLQKLECPEYLLRDSLQFVYESKLNFNLRLSIVKLYYGYVPGSTVEIISRLCPNIAIFYISVNNDEETIIAESLNRLLCLQELYLRFRRIGVNIQLIGLKEFGHRLKVLSLIKYGFNVSDLALISKHCFNLKILCLPYYKYDLRNADLNVSLIERNLIPKFGSLLRLRIDVEISSTLFAIMNKQIPYLKVLDCTEATIDEFPAAVRDITAHGSWSHLEVLALPEESSYEDKFLICLLGSLKNLKKLAVDLPLSSQLTVMKFISEQSLSVRTCSYSNLPDIFM